MSDGPPEFVAINHDDYHAEHVGCTSDGRQFFLTTPFLPAANEAGGEFVALYLFDAGGDLLEARIDDFGPRANCDFEAREQLYRRRLEELGPVTYRRIEVRPFQVERFGTTFGLMIHAPEDEDDVWAVNLQPGDYMAFFEPFDSGEYYT